MKLFSNLLLLALFLWSQLVWATSAPQDTKDWDRINKLNAIFVGCELNGKCILTMVEQIALVDPSPFYLNMLKSLQGQKEEFDYNESHCNSEDIRSVKREVTECLKDSLTKASDSKMIETNNMVNDLNGCIKQRMEVLASSENLFALNMLASHALQLKDQQGQDHWSQLIQKQQGTPQYANYELCLPHFQLFPQAMMLSMNSKKK